MTSPIISVQNLSKSYRLYAKPADRLKEALMPWRVRHSPFHALHDVNFEVQPGEHLGILGINGAGKSTLLQILTGVLTPSSGDVKVRGRVTALLELGSGFNPQLTGRENVTFQLQLNNLSDREIDKKMKEVEAFADVGEFFDQPMKIHSSGMYVRVAFASAILADPDILIVDEALSVGDARFQKKCFDQFNTLKARGTTVILVTHDIFGAKTNCSRLLLLHHGRLIANGDPEDVVTQYMQILYPSSVQDSLHAEAEDKGTDRLTESCLVTEGNLPGDIEYESNCGETESCPACENNYSNDIFHVDPAAATNRWGKGGATLTGMRFFGLLPPNRFIKGQKIVIECDYIFEPKYLIALAEKENVTPELAVGMRIDAGNGLTLCDFSSAVVGRERLRFDIKNEEKATFLFEGTLPNLVPGTYFFTPEVSIGDKDSYIPVIVYENAAMLQCERTELILGLFKPDYIVQRIS